MSSIYSVCEFQTKGSGVGGLCNYFFWFILEINLVLFPEKYRVGFFSFSQWISKVFQGCYMF